MQTNTALTLQHSNNDMWTDAEKLKEVRKLISPEAPLTDIEFNFLTQLGRATQLNPFMKEIWAVKYKQGAPAQIYIGRDGYRKVAQRQPDYEYHQVDAVYSKDDFRITNNEIHHSYGFTGRGELIGAYCIIKRKSSAKPTYVMVSMAEYNQHQSIWKSKPETMIKKVAEAQGLRQAFQEALAGTYSDAEQQADRHSTHTLSGNTQTERLINLLKEREPVTNNVFEIVNVTADENSPATDEQLELIVSLIDDTQYPQERLQKALAHYKVHSIRGLSIYQADRFIEHLNGYIQKLQQHMENQSANSQGNNNTTDNSGIGVPITNPSDRAHSEN